MRIELVVAAAVPLMLMASPAASQETTSLAAGKILSGAFPRAERTLLAEQQAHPGRPEVMLNLAAVYYATGRRDEARALYEQVLAQDDIMLEVSTQRVLSAHAVARKGLRYLDLAQRTASR